LYSKVDIYLDKIRHIVEEEGGVLEQPDLREHAERCLVIGVLDDREEVPRTRHRDTCSEVVKTETFPAEPVAIFTKALA
jgi:hypothetical protein